MGPPTSSNVCLQRDALTTPWGFRLQGGKDFKTPLTVQRVFVGSPADGELHRGDAILGINGYDASNMIHKQAQDLIKNAGGTINLVVRKVSGAAPPRGVLSPTSRQGFSAPVAEQDTYRSRVLDTFTPKPAPPIGSIVTNAHAPMNYNRPQQQGFTPNQYGTDYSQPRPVGQAYGHVRAPPAPGSMLNRVQNSLTATVYGPGGAPYDLNGGQEDENYTPVPVNQLKQVFNRPDNVQQARPRQRPPPTLPTSRPAWSKPVDIDPGLSEPGWSPGTKSPYQQAPRYQPQHQQPVNRPVNRPLPPAAAPVQQDDFRPAWSGSLKSSGGPKQWEMREGAAIAQGGAGPPPPSHGPVNVHQPRVQNVHYGPGADAPEYQQRGDAGASDNASVAHLQYNTPIGLYSKQNVSEVLQGQTGGRPGEGTMQVTGGGPGQKLFDPNRSEVLRLLQEEEAPRHPRGYGLRPQGPQQGSAGPTSPAQHHSPRGPQQNQEEQHYGGYMDPNKQSPMMHALENQMETMQVGDGTSDF